MVLIDLDHFVDTRRENGAREQRKPRKRVKARWVRGRQRQVARREFGQTQQVVQAHEGTDM